MCRSRINWLHKGTCVEHQCIRKQTADESAFSAHVLRSATHKKCHVTGMLGAKKACLRTYWMVVDRAKMRPCKMNKTCDSKINIHIEYIYFLLSLFLVQEMDKNENCSYSAVLFSITNLFFRKIENGIFDAERISLE
ncbi:hypothetical protein CEXT_661961 [Caerostris extrusa]|uniref:Uncharacterized protein n=1 Tax=Caerostris extrusa TaxID=172846 RepID=A0AAV4Y0R0_CAEEX|nr:hypothetical protein CEXT_661961 [Caerostris extrusa]